MRELHVPETKLTNERDKFSSTFRFSPTSTYITASVCVCVCVCVSQGTSSSTWVHVLNWLPVHSQNNHSLCHSKCRLWQGYRVHAHTDIHWVLVKKNLTYHQLDILWPQFGLQSRVFSTQKCLLECDEWVAILVEGMDGCPIVTPAHSAKQVELAFQVFTVIGLDGREGDG